MPKPPQAARSLRRYRGRARSRFAALCPQSQPTALPHTVTIPGVVAQPPTGQTSKSTRRLTGSRGPLNTGRDPYGDAVSVRLQIGTLSGFVSERRPASNRNGVRLQVGIGVRLRRYPHLKLGIDVGQTTAAKYMAKRTRPPSQVQSTAHELIIRSRGDVSQADRSVIRARRERPMAAVAVTLQFQMR